MRMMFKKPATLVLLPDEQSWKERQLLPDERSWKERQRVDFRKRKRVDFRKRVRSERRCDRKRKRVDFRKRERREYKRPDAGKRPKTHSGGNKQRTRIPTKYQVMKREGAFIVKGEQEEESAKAEPTVKQDQFTSKERDEEDKEKQRTCNSVFGCGKCFCDQCYPPGDALGRRR